MLAPYIATDSLSYQQYMPEEEKRRCIIDVRGGRLVNHLGITLKDRFLLEGPPGRWVEEEATCLFVMDGEGQIYVAPQRVVEHHSCFLAGRPVASAGVIGFNENGFVSYLTAASGHYAPPRDYFGQVVTELKKRKAVILPGAVDYTINPLTSFQYTLRAMQGGGLAKVTDYSTGVVEADRQITGTHRAGQRLRLYPESRPKWQWF
jgi:hypothetical protein